LDAKAEQLAQRYEGCFENWFADWKAEVARESEQVLLSRDEAANMLGISLSSVKRLKQRGELPNHCASGSGPCATS
jgi:hypothetical protein